MGHARVKCKGPCKVGDASCEMVSAPPRHLLVRSLKDSGTHKKCKNSRPKPRISGLTIRNFGRKCPKDRSKKFSVPVVQSCAFSVQTKWALSRLCTPLLRVCCFHPPPPGTPIAVQLNVVGPPTCQSRGRSQFRSLPDFHLPVRGGGGGTRPRYQASGIRASGWVGGGGRHRKPPPPKKGGAAAH